MADEQLLRRAYRVLVRGEGRGMLSAEEADLLDELRPRFEERLPDRGVAGGALGWKAEWEWPGSGEFGDPMFRRNRVRGAV